MCVGSWSQLFLLKFNLRDDDDEFLYGDTELKESSLSKIPADLIPAPVPSAGETPLPALVSCARRVLYSTRQRNIIDILLTSSLRARQLNRMSEFSNCQPSAHTPLTLHLLLLAYRSARWCQLMTTCSRLSVLLRTQLLCRPMLPPPWKRRTLPTLTLTRTRMRRPGMAATHPKRVTR